MNYINAIFSVITFNTGSRIIIFLAKCFASLVAYGQQTILRLGSHNITFVLLYSK